MLIFGVDLCSALGAAEYVGIAVRHCHPTSNAFPTRDQLFKISAAFSSDINILEGGDPMDLNGGPLVQGLLREGFGSRASREASVVNLAAPFS
jgi:hypothetical protein